MPPYWRQVLYGGILLLILLAQSSQAFRRVLDRPAHGKAKRNKPVSETA
jgi:hypothetical protein